LRSGSPQSKACDGDVNIADRIRVAPAGHGFLRVLDAANAVVATILVNTAMMKESCAAYGI
jgi:hypothetical protein